MGIRELLFGEHVPVLVGTGRRRRRRRLTPKRLAAMRKKGKPVVRLDRVPVHLIDGLKGPLEREWRVGTDVAEEVVARMADPGTGALYAVVLYEGAEVRETKITDPQRWAELAEEYRLWDEGGGSV